MLVSQEGKRNHGNHGNRRQLGVCGRALIRAREGPTPRAQTWRSCWRRPAASSRPPAPAGRHRGQSLRPPASPWPPLRRGGPGQEAGLSVPDAAPPKGPQRSTGRPGDTPNHAAWPDRQGPLRGLWDVPATQTTGRNHVVPDVRVRHGSARDSMGLGMNAGSFPDRAVSSLRQPLSTGSALPACVFSPGTVGDAPHLLPPRTTQGGSQPPPGHREQGPDDQTPQPESRGQCGAFNATSVPAATLRGLGDRGRGRRAGPTRRPLSGGLLVSAGDSAPRGCLRPSAGQGCFWPWHTKLSSRRRELKPLSAVGVPGQFVKDSHIARGPALWDP